MTRDPERYPADRDPLGLNVEPRQLKTMEMIDEEIRQGKIIVEIYPPAIDSRDASGGQGKMLTLEELRKDNPRRVEALTLTVKRNVTELYSDIPHRWDEAFEFEVVDRGLGSTEDYFYMRLILDEIRKAGR